MLWRWLLVAALVAAVGLLLFAHAAGVEVWTWGSGIGAAAVAALAVIFGRRKAPPPEPPPVLEPARREEAVKVAAAEGAAKLEETRIVEHRAEEQKKPLGDRAQELIDRNRARRP